MGPPPGRPGWRRCGWWPPPRCAAAADREAFLDRAEAALGVRPEVITGEEEAVLSFEGADGGLCRAGALSW